MLRASSRANRTVLAGLVLIFAIVTAFVFWSGNGKVLGPRRGLKTDGDARLVSIEPLPEANGPMCETELVPASAATSLFAELEQQQEQSQSAPEAEPRPSDAAREAGSKRRPVRMIKDPNPGFCAVGLDLAHDEVVLQDENTFSILTYNRLENTPPKARMSEPKRMIHGEHSQLEYNSSMYVDPVNGDIYSVSNDTLNLLTVYSHDAKGDVGPSRVLKVPYFFGMAVDEERQEMILAAQGGIVVTFKKTAKDYDKPLRFIQGDKTRLADSHGVAVDSKHSLIFVTNWGTTHQIRVPAASAATWGDGSTWGAGYAAGVGAQSIPGTGFVQPPSITVYDRDAKGDVAPLRIIQGSKTQLSWPTSIAVDPEHGELFVANDAGDSITVYNSDANGDAEPIRVIKGPKSLVKSPTGVVYDPKHDELWVANFANHSATVYKRTASGDAAPLRIIRSAPLDAPAPMMSNPHTIAYNDSREEIFVVD